MSPKTKYQTVVKGDVNSSAIVSSFLVYHLKAAVLAR